MRKGGTAGGVLSCREARLTRFLSSDGLFVETDKEGCGLHEGSGSLTEACAPVRSKPISRIPYLCTSFEGFLQYVAVHLLPYGFRYYVLGEIPAKKDPLAVDVKLIGRYYCDVGRSMRHKLKKRGLTPVRYLRWERTFLLITTEGNHGVFLSEKKVKDVRKQPIIVGGVSMRHVNGHSHVRLTRTRFMEMKAELEAIACHRSDWFWANYFWNFPYPQYSPIVKQAFWLLNAINRKRAAGGLETIHWQIIKLKRAPVRCFE